jgi:hypothetical protein
LKSTFALFAAITLAALAGCAAEEKVDYRSLLTPEMNSFDDAAFEEAQRKCAGVPTGEQPMNAWCNATRKASNCALRKICPES